MQEEKKKSTLFTKLAMAAGILFWMILFTLALRAAYSLYAAFVPAQSYGLEHMADGSWYITLQGKGGSFSAAAESSLFFFGVQPSNPKGLHLILLATGLISHGALTWCLFWVRDLLNRCVEGAADTAHRCAKGVRQMAWAVGAALVLAPGLKAGLVGALLQGMGLLPVDGMISGILVSVLLWLLSLLFAAMGDMPAVQAADDHENLDKADGQ